MAGRSALVVVVPEVESAVSDIRLRLDPVAEQGVPAHVTVLFPFMPADRIDDDVRATIADAVGGTACFDTAFTTTDWFGQDVLWLAPNCGPEFRSLTWRLSQAFPDYPPYAGQHDDVVPHLTIADRAPLGEMQAADRSVQRALPIHSTVHAVTLLVEQPSGEWATVVSFPLAT